MPTTFGTNLPRCDTAGRYSPRVGSALLVKVEKEVNSECELLATVPGFSATSATAVEATSGSGSATPPTAPSAVPAVTPADQSVPVSVAMRDGHRNSSVSAVTYAVWAAHVPPSTSASSRLRPRWWCVSLTWSGGRTPAGHFEMEQDRAPAVLPHHHELAWTVVDQPSGRPEHDRGDHHLDRPEGRNRLDPSSYPTGIAVSRYRLCRSPRIPNTQPKLQHRPDRRRRPTARRPASRGPRSDPSSATRESTTYTPG